MNCSRHSEHVQKQIKPAGQKQGNASRQLYNDTKNYGIYKSLITTQNVISATVLAMIRDIRLLNPKKEQELHHK